MIYVRLLEERLQRKTSFSFSSFDDHNLPVDTNSAFQFPPLLGSNVFAVDLAVFQHIPYCSYLFWVFSEIHRLHIRMFGSVKYLYTILYICIEEEGCATIVLYSIL